jgi:hypothetical protein
VDNVAELLGSEMALIAAGLAGLAITTIAILRDVSESRRLIVLAASPPTPPLGIVLSA